ncbi:MAG: TatD family hydrolase [Bacteroidota bacterium]
MALLIDTHAHLYAPQFDQDQASVIARAQEVNQAVVLPNIDGPSVEPMRRLAEMQPNFFFPAMGLHPCHVEENFEQQLTELKVHLDATPEAFVAIGETGLDLYWDQSTLARQQAALEIQIGWAKQHALPIILHAREAIDPTAELIEANLEGSRLRGIFHCFDGHAEQAERILSFEHFWLGIGGIVTYRKDVQVVVQALPLERLVLETDSPYLPPVPHRKDKPRRNESSYLRYVAEKIAELKGISYEEVAAVTNANAQAVFPRMRLDGQMEEYKT